MGEGRSWLPSVSETKASSLPLLPFQGFNEQPTPLPPGAIMPLLRHILLHFWGLPSPTPQDGQLIWSHLLSKGPGLLGMSGLDAAAV